MFTDSQTVHGSTSLLFINRSRKYCLCRWLQNFILGFLIFIPLFMLSWYIAIKIRYKNNQCIRTYNSSVLNTSNNTNILSHNFTNFNQLALHHFQILGTHNSYHSEVSISSQMDFGIRQIELDVHIISGKGGYLVYHLQLIDDYTNCYCLSECLQLILKWSQRNRLHYPVFLFIEIKSMFYEDMVTGFTGVKCAHLESIKQQILTIFPSERLIAPDQIQGNFTSITAALKQQKLDEVHGNYSYHGYGWMPLASSLGKIMPVYLDDAHNIADRLTCLTKNPIAAYRFFFIAQSHIDRSYAAIVVLNTITTKQSETAIKTSLANGKIIRTSIFSNYKLYERAFELGIHIISFDFKKCIIDPLSTPYCNNLPNGLFLNKPLVCNSRTAPRFCEISVNQVGANGILF
ncbi:unnamed protein product [Didymodactylos carnosus]|uniref:Uncharacterized protein n=1 Tax=Didymodactylos carnosus TaxID=1234261 RepID=A0A815D8A5_9BILA|nr:unnamed protein product [Didymodactylos carnosus]CAF1297335.1 unnamed protein product [Didymodactylos carnosus]CAF3881824.1 unnamed protein product [Didymodactylos carnosus]CAF4114426.1 unnamed protein product [Didymodactylos carnosus]